MKEQSLLPALHTKFFILGLIFATIAFVLDNSKQLPIVFYTTEVLQPIEYDYVPLKREDEASTSALQSLSARAALVIDASSSAVLFEKEPELVLPPASTTKLITALVARDEYKLGQVVTVPLKAVQQPGATIDLRIGEQITVAELIKGLLIQSGNDAAYALTTLDANGEKGYLRKMNAKARDLQLDQTFFTNAVGFDDEYQTSSARDLLLVAREVVQDPILSNIVGTKKAILTDTQEYYSHYVMNTNMFLHGNEHIRGIKTGTTQNAGEVLITEYYKDGRHLFVVVMGSVDRYSDTELLLEYVLDNYTWQEIIEKSIDYR